MPVASCRSTRRTAEYVKDFYHGKTYVRNDPHPGALELRSLHHTAICLKTLPEVFDVKLRPWIAINAAEAGEIAHTIEQCPTGALTYERLDDTPGELPPSETTIIPMPNGPLYVRGEVEIRDNKGNLIDTGTRMAICRCGHSQNQPFCDLSHRKAGFRSVPRVDDPQRKQAQSPDDINPRT